jgi:hypothetical protein
MQRLRKYQQFAARCLQEARSATDPRLKAFWQIAPSHQRFSALPVIRQVAVGSLRSSWSSTLETFAR